MEVEKESTTLRSADYQKKCTVSINSILTIYTSTFQNISEEDFCHLSPGLSGEDGPLEGTFLGGRGGGAEGKENKCIKNK